VDAPTAAAPVEGAPTMAVPAAAPVAPRPKHTPWVTFALAAANIGIWILTVALGASPLDPSAQWLFEHGGNMGAATLAGEPWRLFTSMFLHSGVLHLAMNMLGLLGGGQLIERLFGRVGFTAIYVIAGLAGSLASALRPDAGIVSVGASGAIFGVLGAVGAYYVLHRERVDQSTLNELKGLLACVAYNVIFGLQQSGIDMYAHTGGFVGGLLCGLALARGHDRPPLRRAVATGVLGVAAVIAAAFVVPVPVDEDRAAIMTFASVEKQILARWSELVDQSRAESMTEAQLADAIEQELLPPWRAGRAAFEQSGAGGPKRDVLIDYMRLRQEGWEIMAKGLRASDVPTIKRGQARFRESDEAAKRLSD